MLDAMPSSIAARANPSDLGCAKKDIQEGVDQIFITIQKAEGVFLLISSPTLTLLILERVCEIHDPIPLS